MQKPNQDLASHFAYQRKLSNLWLLLALQKGTFKNTPLDSVKLAKATNGMGFRLMESLWHRGTLASLYTTLRFTTLIFKVS